jgi:putative DNA methylase
VKAGLPDDDQPLSLGGKGARAYGDAIAVYAALGVDRSADFWCSIATWSPQPKNELVSHAFTKQAIPMTWDFAEANPFSGSGGNFIQNLSFVAKCIEQFGLGTPGTSVQADAGSQELSSGRIVSTDPPYYDNIAYADLSDFFYVWLRRSLKPVFPELFATVAVPKAAELVASPYRHGGKEHAENFFLEGMTRAMHQIATQSHPGFPVTIYYSFKQSENEGEKGSASTGWDTFLEAVIRAGLAITGTWPIRTERGARSTGIGTNALASSIVLVCRHRDFDAPAATRREFLSALKTELPAAVAHLQRGNIAPVDLAQAAIGPGMAVYTRYSKVLDASGARLPVRGALALINEVLDETLADQEGDFDADTRWAVAWCDQVGFAEGEFDAADKLSKAKNTSVAGLARAGILVSGRGKARLLRPSELPKNWDPSTDERLTVWEMVHQLIRVLEADGESGAAGLAAKLGANAERARELAYRLFTICERRKRAGEALGYNALVQSWPEISRLAREGTRVSPSQANLFDSEE